MTSTSQPPREGRLLPGFQLQRVGGGTVRIRTYRGRRSLALLFIHNAACAACRAYLVGALERYAGYGDEGAEAVVIVPDTAERAATMRSELALPFPIAVDEDGAVARRYGLVAGKDAAVMVTDRFGEPRIWQVAGAGHDFPDHESLLAEVRYLALTCSGGCSVPIWNEP